MSEKKIGGFIFRIYLNDHRPYHVHVFRGSKEIGRFDIENQKSMDKGFKVTGQVRKALKKVGYLK